MKRRKLLGNNAMTVEEAKPNEEPTLVEELTPTNAPVEENSEALEEEAFNASVNSLVPDSEPSPLEDKEQETVNPVVEEKAADAEAEAVAEAIKPFIGDMSEEQVLELLGKVSGMESNVFEKVSQKVFGKFGEIGQQLKALNEREFRFDPEKLSKLKEVDEGIAEALASDLKEAFSGQQFDGEAVLNDFKTSLMSDLNPYIEERLLTALAPDADEIVKTDEFSEWFFKEAKQDVRDNFDAWDKRERMDGVAMAGAFKAFGDWKDAKNVKATAKQDNLKRAVESSKTPSAAPTGAQPMSEEEAFNTRLNEARR